MKYTQKTQKALDFAEYKHRGQLDDCGKSYFEVHICQVADILSRITMDDDIICAGLLHDTLEDTETTFKELQKEFGLRVADLVYQVTHDGTNDNYGYYFPRLEMKDAILIKFADRLSNLSRMEAWAIPRQEQYLSKSKFWNDGQDKFTARG